MPTAQDVYRSFLKERVTPVLRQQGLKGSGNEFVLPDDDDWLLIGFQKSRYSDSAQVDFTVNLLSMPKWQLRSKPSANESRDGAWTARLFTLLPGQEEQDWWVLRADASEDEVAALADEVTDALVAQGLPALRERRGAYPPPARRG